MFLFSPFFGNHCPGKSRWLMSRPPVQPWPPRWDSTSTPRYAGPGPGGAAGRILPSRTDASLSPAASPPLAGPLGPLRGRGSCQLCQYPHDAATVSATCSRGARGTRLPLKASRWQPGSGAAWSPCCGFPSQGLEGVGGQEGGEPGSACLRCRVSGGGCWVGWLSLCPEKEGDFGLRIAILGSGLEDP